MNLSEPGRLPYPSVDPYASGHLEVDELHQIYWETSGNPQGMPVVFLHGGPGGGTLPAHRRFFDPAHYRIILFDQRGAGRSLPKGEIRANTTAHLIADMERLREFLQVDQWLLFGGSWGSTLALAYGQAHPQRCLGFILRGIFLGEAREIRWFLHDLQTVHPEAWRAFSEFLPAAERGDLLGAYRSRLGSEDPAIHLPAARAWAHYEASASTLLPNADLVRGMEHEALTLARLEAHYMAHDMFLAERQLLAGVGAIRHLPAILVQGRYDMVCPIAAADELARAWPEAYYEIIPDAGHSAFEPGVTRALAGATEAFKRLLPLAEPQETPPKGRRPRTQANGKSKAPAAKAANKPKKTDATKTKKPFASEPEPQEAAVKEAGKNTRRGSRRRRKAPGAASNEAEN